MTEKNPLKSFFNREDVKQKFEELLGKKTNAFIAALLQITVNNEMLSTCDPKSIYAAAMTAAALDLPISKELGFAWIVPYRQKGLVQAQFQIGWKGFVQLAHRTGEYVKLNVCKVHANQFISFNTLTEEIIIDFSKPAEGEIAGYATYFRLKNGFEKVDYWSKARVTAHAQRFSKTFNNGPWQTDFDAMAMKTAVKSILSKWGILSIEMSTAHLADQSVIDGDEYSYVDNEKVQESASKQLISESEILEARLEIEAGNTSLENIEDIYDLFPEQVEFLKTGQWGS